MLKRKVNEIPITKLCELNLKNKREQEYAYSRESRLDSVKLSPLTMLFSIHYLEMNIWKVFLDPFSFNYATVQSIM